MIECKGSKVEQTGSNQLPFHRHIFAAHLTFNGRFTDTLIRDEKTK